jgi:hypothetical protein
LVPSGEAPNCRAAAAPALARSAPRTPVGVPLALLALASRKPSARSPSVTIVWSTADAFACVSLVPSWPRRTLRSTWRVTDHAFVSAPPGFEPGSGVAALPEPSHPASLALVRVRRHSLKRIPCERSRALREIPRLSAGFRLDPHAGVTCRQVRTQASRAARGRTAATRDTDSQPNATRPAGP